MAKEIPVGRNTPKVQPEIPVTPQEDKKTDLSMPRVDLSEQAKATKTSEELVDLLISRAPDDLLPWEKIAIPSRGIYYDGKIPDGMVEVRPMGLYTDKILATARLTQSGQAIDYVYKNCVRFSDKTFDPLDLLVGDRMFLLFYLRGITHGNLYEFQLTCSNDDCKKQSLHTYNLNNLANNIKGPKYQKEPVRIHLPYFSKITQKDIWIDARFMRGRDINVILRKQKFAEQMKGGSKVRDAKTGNIIGSTEISLDTTIEENLNLLIVSVNGVADRDKIQQIISRLHGQDTATIRETLRDAEPGIDTKIIVNCPECANEMRIDLPITESFFRPTNPAGV